MKSGPTKILCGEDNRSREKVRAASALLWNCKRPVMRVRLCAGSRFLAVKIKRGRRWISGLSCLGEGSFDALCNDVLPKEEAGGGQQLQRFVWGTGNFGRLEYGLMRKGKAEI